MASEKNYYDILEVSRTARLERIEKNYKQLRSEFHPDKNSAWSKAECELRFREITEAYENLKDPQKREEHDRKLDRRAADEEAARERAAREAVHEEYRSRQAEAERAARTRNTAAEENFSEAVVEDEEDAYDEDETDENDDSSEEYYQRARSIVLSTGVATIESLKQRLQIRSGDAKDFLGRMCIEGLVEKPFGSIRYKFVGKIHHAPSKADSENRGSRILGIIFLVVFIGWAIHFLVGGSSDSEPSANTAVSSASVPSPSSSGGLAQASDTALANTSAASPAYPVNSPTRRFSRQLEHGKHPEW